MYQRPIASRSLLRFKHKHLDHGQKSWTENKDEIYAAIKCISKTTTI